MSILPFKKQQMDLTVELVNELRDLRTKKKQLTIREKEIISQMNEACASDNYLYDLNQNPVAKLTIYTTTRFDTTRFKQSHHELYGEFTQLSTTRKWGLI